MASISDFHLSSTSPQSLAATGGELWTSLSPCVRTATSSAGRSPSLLLRATATVSHPALFPRCGGRAPHRAAPLLRLRPEPLLRRIGRAGSAARRSPFAVCGGQAGSAPPRSFATAAGLAHPPAVCLRWQFGSQAWILAAPSRRRSAGQAPPRNGDGL